MRKSFEAPKLPVDPAKIDQCSFLDVLISATSKLEVYKSKLNDSKVSSSWILPTLQNKEALASTKLEGTQATLDGMLLDQITPKEDDQDINETRNYLNASFLGFQELKRNSFSKDLLCQLHKTLLSGNVRKRENSIIGSYRTTQNYIGLVGGAHDVTYVPPKPECVEDLMKNLIDYMNNPSDNYQPLVRTAIIHAQMLTIHPFDDGNGRVGRILIPLYLHYAQQIELPCFFISEALESDKFMYYRLLNETREEAEWNEWIRFFLSAVAKQCEKYIYIIDGINALYEKHIRKAGEVIKNSAVVKIIDSIYRHPILTAAMVVQETGLSYTTVNRYLGQLTNHKFLYTDSRRRNKNYNCYDLLDVLKI